MNPITEPGHPNTNRLQDGRRRPKQTNNTSPKPYMQQIKTHPPPSQLKKICSDFAAIFSYELIKNMRSTIPNSSFLKEFQGGKLVNSMVDQKMAQYLSSQNGFGLKELLLKTLTTENMNIKNKSEVIKNPARKE